MRFAVFWRISVRFCGFQTPLTPPSLEDNFGILTLYLGHLTFSCYIKAANGLRGFFSLKELDLVLK